MSAANTTPTPDDLTKLTRLLDNLPTLPVVALRLGEVLHSRRSSVNQVAELLASDPALSAKLLRLVNSAYFGIPGGVTDIAKAIPFVGFNTIYQLVLSVSVLDTLKSPGGGVFDPRPLWMHSLAVGSAARVIAQEVRHADPGCMFTAGLLHDMGKIALATVAPVAFLSARIMQHEENISSVEAETRAGLPTHDRVGADLAKRWRLPANLSVPIEAHHTVLDPASRDRLTQTYRIGAEIIAASNLLAQNALDAITGTERAPEDPRATQLLNSLGLGSSDRNALHRRVALQLERSRPFLDLLGA
jgi:HD-like signal output (HDOD) protein